MNYFKPLSFFNQLKPLLFNHGARGHKMQVMKTWPGGVEYDGFTYYPRPGQVDPPYTATKLFLVKRRKEWWGNFIKHKRTLNAIGLGRMKRTGSHCIVKNTTDMNARLWRIKHLIEIKPILTPDGLPAEGDISACDLDLETGVLRIRPEIKQDEKRLTSVQECSQNPKRVKKDVWKKDCRLRWNAKWE